jgi:uncharacterized protein (DUF111 family)
VDLHLNITGSLSGEMFIAAVLDAFPHLETRVLAVIEALDVPYPITCTVEFHSDYELTGRRFEIEPFDKYFGLIPFAFAHARATWESARRQLDAAEIKGNICLHARRIFDLIERAELDQRSAPQSPLAKVAGGWSSIAQVVGAAALIEALEAVHWTASPYTLGEGSTLTANAIVDYLCPTHLRGRPLPRARSLVRSGTGFASGSSKNSCLRVLCFDEGDAATAAEDRLAQSPERVQNRAGPRPRQ